MGNGRLPRDRTAPPKLLSPPPALISSPAPALTNTPTGNLSYITCLQVCSAPDPLETLGSSLPRQPPTSGPAWRPSVQVV